MIIALTACFALLIVMFACQPIDGEMDTVQVYSDRNETLSLHVENDGIIRIEGDGKLFAYDLKVLLKTNRIRNRNVNDIIIGDGITEIGYNAFNNMKYLETLKIGSGVVRVAPSALKNCVSLEWLYIPSGLEEVGGGFLFKCEKCNVVTNAQPEALPPLDNVKDTRRIFAAVDSFDALRAAVGADTALPDALEHWWR